MIWIVVKEQGEYSDYSWIPLRAFTSEETANEYAEKMKTRNGVLRELQSQVQGWEALYREQNPEPRLTFPDKPPVPQELTEILRTQAPALKAQRKEAQKKRQEMNDAWRAQTDAISKEQGELITVWYDSFNPARLEYIRKSFAQEFEKFGITEDKLIGYHNYYYEAEWKVYSLPLDNETPRLFRVGDED
jgi:hypothetical protein